MLIIKITQKGKIVYHGATSIEVEKLDETRRRVKMRNAGGVKRISDIDQADTVTILNEMVIL